MTALRAGRPARPHRQRLVQDDQFGELTEFFVEFEKPGRTIANLQRALAHSPDIVQGMAVLGEAVRFSTDLSSAWLELAILRVGILTRCPYPFAHHVKIAQGADVTDEQIHRVVDWVDAPCFDEAERLILRATDEIAADAGLSDETFALLSADLGERQVVELVMLISFYCMLARLVNSLGVPVDDRAVAVLDAYWPFTMESAD